ncbi:MAG: YccF domain-containing protein [Oscillospiraceae bacterium]|jgi:uncharacterized membrane protein YccF (DUF307 family)|nr:YccF domain-containing protein [Oscillospiraceae bacterium]
MKLIGNIVWFIFGGLEMAFFWCLVGLLQFVTVIGIPTGLQAFKIARLAVWPFGKTVTYGGGGGRLLLNIIWIILGGLILAIGNALLGIVFCVTVVGIPFGKQYLKLAKLSLMPFGATIS